jgi:hypothetical protein
MTTALALCIVLTLLAALTLLGIIAALVALLAGAGVGRPSADTPRPTATSRDNEALGAVREALGTVREASVGAGNGRLRASWRTARPNDRDSPGHPATNPGPQR